MYLEAVFAILFGRVRSWGLLVITICFIVGAVGISNEKKLGYNMAIGTALVNVVVLVWLLLSRGFGFIFALLIAIVLLALLLHPQSRHYGRIWFR